MESASTRAATLHEALKEAGMVDMHLEGDVISVSDVERSKQFYIRLGWRLDDAVPGNEIDWDTMWGSWVFEVFGHPEQKRR
jgi:hypothetical protein